MPLIILTGYPCSGKSRRATELEDYLSINSRRKVTVISDQLLLTNKNAAYADSRQEKEIRSILKSKVQHLINKDDIVILDSANYIKGYRYELYCISKSAKSTQCTVHCETCTEAAWSWNLCRPESDRYSREIFDELIARYEAPDNRNRWDVPLFTIQMGDSLPFDNIMDALFQRKAPPPNQSTQSLPLTSTNFLYELDCVTREIVNRVVEAQKNGVIGDFVSIPNSSEKILLKRQYQLAELSRIRRQFISFTKTHPVEDLPQLASMFTQYLTSNLS